ncbi:MAG: Zn-dependent exopeptidase M28 [Ruminococcaceae bacterium]|nr:Zn-dependent exopeptidase M28 [Oscillospiraceae bacterium]
MILCSTLLHLVTDEFRIHYFVLLTIYFSLFFLMMAGPPNKHTANDNTSGIITLCELYTSLTEEEKKKVAIVFFDNEENGLLGSRAFKKEHKNTIAKQLLINFDCVSDGDHILFAQTKGARKKWNIEPFFPCSNFKHPMFEKAEQVFYPSDQKGFPNSIAVAALNHNKFLGYYMSRIHTPRDTVFDEENIRYLCSGFHAFIASFCGVISNA